MMILKLDMIFQVGQRLLFRDGRTKGIGRVTQVFHSKKAEGDAER